MLPLGIIVVLSYLGFWLTWSRQPRTMFLYHYLNALPFLILLPLGRTMPRWCHALRHPMAHRPRQY